MHRQVYLPGWILYTVYRQVYLPGWILYTIHWSYLDQQYAYHSDRTYPRGYCIRHTAMNLPEWALWSSPRTYLSEYASWCCRRRCRCSCRRRTWPPADKQTVGRLTAGSGDKQASGAAQPAPAPPPTHTGAPNTGGHSGGTQRRLSQRHRALCTSRCDRRRQPAGQGRYWEGHAAGACRRVPRGRPRTESA